MHTTKKIKILRIINRFNIGGPVYNAVLLTAFMPTEYETLLIGGLPEKEEENSIYIAEKYGIVPELIEEMQRTPNLKNDKKALKRIKEIILAFRPDIVHTHASKAGALGRKAAIDCGVPIIIHTFHGHIFHSYFSRWKTKMYQLIEQRLAQKSTGIIAISELQKTELSEKYKICEKEKIEVIPLGFDLMPFNQNKDKNRKKTRVQFQLDEHDVAVAIVGRLAPIKNHSLFLNCIKQIHEKTTKKIVYFIVGDGEEYQAISEEVSQLTALGLNIKMTSWIKDIAEFNAGMDILCLSSKNEGTPVSLIEAQAAGIPFVTTDVGGIRDIVAENQTGFVVNLNNPSAFTEKLLYLIENENKRLEMSQNGWLFVEDKFDCKTLVKNMDEYYKKKLNGALKWS
jgi:glycosyltransferase involved in cell wall biosynthesis